MIATELVSRLSLRLRGPAHDENFIRLILSHSQRLVNSHLKTILSTDTLITQPTQQVYSMSLLPDALRVETVQEGGRDLAMAPWRALAHVSRTWFREVGSHFQVFSKVGRNLLIVHPAKHDLSVVTVISTKLTDALEPTTTVELADSDLLSVLDLAEAVLLVRERRFKSVPEVVKRLSARMGINVKGDRLTARR